MKKMYATPELEIILYKVEDICSVSQPNVTSEDNEVSGKWFD